MRNFFCITQVKDPLVLIVIGTKDILPTYFTLRFHEVVVPYLYFTSKNNISTKEWV